VEKVVVSLCFSVNFMLNSKINVTMSHRKLLIICACDIVILRSRKYYEEEEVLRR